MKKLLLLLLVPVSLLPQTPGTLPGTKFDYRNFDVLQFSGTERIPQAGKVHVSIPKDPNYKGTYLKAPLWPKCSGRQENDPQGPFWMDDVTNDGFTLRGKKDMVINWTCAVLARKPKADG